MRVSEKSRGFITVGIRSTVENRFAEQGGKASYSTVAPHTSGAQRLLGFCLHSSPFKS